MAVNIVAQRRCMALLEAGVPLSLLCDLVDPAGPESVTISTSEPSPNDASLPRIDTGVRRPTGSAAAG